MKKGEMEKVVKMKDQKKELGAGKVEAQKGTASKTDKEGKKEFDKLKAATTTSGVNPKGQNETLSKSATPANKFKVKKAFSKVLNIKKGKGLFWATADVYRKNPVEYIIFSMRDFVFYAMFVVLTGLIAFGDLDPHYNYYGNVVAEVLTNSKFVTGTGQTKGFTEIHGISEIWRYMNAVLLKVLHNAHYQTYEEFKGYKVLTESILVGSPRLRQKRVKNGTCQTAGIFEDVYRSCYDYYTDDNEDKEDFGSGYTLTSSAWKYTERVDDELSYSAPATVFGPGGFVMTFSTDANQTAQLLKELEDNLWIRLGSRAVFIEFALYSPNANLFCTVKLVFEILPSGGVTTGTEIITSKLWHESAWHWFLFGCKIIFSVYTIYFTLEELTQILILKEAYLSNWWNILDTTIIVMCYVVLIFGVDHFHNVQTLNAKIHNVFNPDYSSFDRISSSLAAYQLVTALLMFLVWLKLFKFAVLSKTTAFLLSTFSTASYQIMSVTCTMIGIVTGFALLGTILLDKILQFRSFADSFFTLYGLLVGGLYFLEANKHSLTGEAKIYLATYIIFVLVIYSSTYVAIIVNGFRKAIFELDDDRRQVYFGDIWTVWSYKMTHFWQNKEKAADVLYRRGARKLITRNFEELLEILRRRGCRGMELAFLLKKHNVRPGEVVPFETVFALYNDFVAKCQLSVEVEGHVEIFNKMEMILNTVDLLDMTLGDVWIKMDTLANKLAVRRAEKNSKIVRKKP